ARFFVPYRAGIVCRGRCVFLNGSVPFPRKSMPRPQVKISMPESGDFLVTAPKDRATKLDSEFDQTCARNSRGDLVGPDPIRGQCSFLADSGYFAVKQIQ